jgi:putative acetyltransferase
MLTLKRTSSENQNFISLVKLLDEELADRDGADHSYYAQFNKIEKIKYVIVAYEDGTPVSCGAIKEHKADTMEVKRMYTKAESRGKGIAGKVLSELEKWAKEMNNKKCILETGKRQPEAIRLYEKNGYKLIPNYDQYVGMENSVCYKKEITI